MCQPSHWALYMHDLICWSQQCWVAGFIIFSMMKHTEVWNFPKVAELKLNASSLTREWRVSKPLTSGFASFFSVQYLFGFCLRLTSWACCHDWSICMTFCLVLHLSPVKSNLTSHFLILKPLYFLQIQLDPPLLPGGILIASILEKNYAKSPLHHLIHWLFLSLAHKSGKYILNSGKYIVEEIPLLCHTESSLILLLLLF